MGLIVSGLIGSATALLFAYILYWLDRYEKEPLLLDSASLHWGQYHIVKANQFKSRWPVAPPSCLRWSTTR